MFSMIKDKAKKIINKNQKQLSRKDQKRVDKLLTQVAERKSFANTSLKILKYAGIAFGTLCVLFPLYWMIISSFKSADEAMSILPVLWPAKLLFENYGKVFEMVDVGTYFSNSLITSTISVIGTLLVITPAAFALSHYNFKGKAAVTLFFLATYMVPMQSLLAGRYFVSARFGILDTRVVLWLPFLASVFQMLIIKNAFDGIGKSVKQSSKIDGASTFKFFRTIAIPIIKPAIITSALLSLIESWNGYLWTMLTITSENLKTMPLMLFKFIGEDLREPNVQMAAAVIVVIPLFIIYLIFRKRIINGVANGIGGTKGE